MQENTNQNSNPKKSFLRKTIIILVFIFLILGFVYFYLNLPAIWEKTNYSSEKKEQAFAITPSKDKISKNFYRLIFLDTVENYPGTGPINTTTTSEAPKSNDEPASGPDEQSSQISPSRDYNNYLFIPKLNKKTPIVWDSSLDNETMLANLQKGVIHYSGTSKPGEKASDGDGEGNIFIAGHSSYYRWDKGKYKTIFANLDRLESGDQLAIVYNSQIYVYNVVEKKVVMPEDVSVLSQATSTPTLSLMTCVPVGTNEKRLIVRAEFAGFAE